MARPGTTMNPGIFRFPCQRKYRQPYRAADTAESLLSPLPTFPHRGRRSIPAVTPAATAPGSGKIRPCKKNTTR